MVVLGFPGGSVVKNLPANAGDVSWIPLREGHGNPLQYSCLGKSHGQRSLVGYTVRWVAKRQVPEHTPVVLEC